MSQVKTPTWLRVVEIILGAICVGMSFTVLANPALTSLLTITFVGIAFFFVGISRVITGLASKNLPGSSRVITIGIGALAIGISIVAKANPILGLKILTIYIAFSLLGYGAGDLAASVASKASSKGDRTLHVVVGVLTIGFALAIIAFPGLTIMTMVFFLSIALMITGIGSIISGIEGERRFIRLQR